MMSRRDHHRKISMLVGGNNSLRDWKHVVVPRPEDGHQLTEPCWTTLPDGQLCILFRDQDSSRRIYRCFSNDHGTTWTTPVRTNYPDAKSKIFVIRLTNGTYALINNPNVLHPDPKVSGRGLRNPLCISLSRDGMTFDRMAALRRQPTSPRISGRAKNPGYQYPHALEHEGHLYVIHAVNKEDIEVLRLPISRLVELSN